MLIGLCRERNESSVEHVSQRHGHRKPMPHHHVLCWMVRVVLTEYRETVFDRKDDGFAVGKAYVWQEAK